MEQTEAQRQASLNPQATTAPTFSSAGLFRAVGDYGTSVFNSNGQALNLISDEGGLFKDSAERASFGNAGGQASEALNRLKSKYGIDWNALPQMNIGDYVQQQNKTWQGAPSGFTFNSTGNNADSFFGAGTQSAQIGSTPVNTTPNQLASPQAVAQAQTQGLQSYFQQQNQQSNPDIQKLMTNSGVSSSGNFARTPTGQIVDITTGQVVQGGATTNAPISSPMGTLSPTAPVNIMAGSKDSFSSSSLNSGLSTADVLNNQKSYADTINGYLQQQANAQAQLNNVKAQELQGQAQIMYGKNAGSGGADANVQGAQREMFARQMAFNQVPAEIALQNAQVALALFKQSPQYQNEQQARDAFYALQQQYPDVSVTYDPTKTAQENLQTATHAAATSPRYQALSTTIRSVQLPGGGLGFYNSKDGYIYDEKGNIAGRIGGGGAVTTFTTAADGAADKADAASLEVQQKYADSTQRAFNTANANLQQLVNFMGSAGVNTSSSIPLINSIENQVKGGVLDPGTVAAYKAALAGLRTEYTQVLSRGGDVTQGQRDQAKELLPDNLTPRQLQQVTDRLKIEGDNAIKEAQGQVKTIQDRMAARGKGTSTTPPSKGGTWGWNP